MYNIYIFKCQPDTKLQTRAYRASANHAHESQCQKMTTFIQKIVFFLRILNKVSLVMNIVTICFKSSVLMNLICLFYINSI